MTIVNPQVAATPSEADAGQRRIAVTVLLSHPIQYFVPVYRRLAAADDLDVRVVYRTRVGVDGYTDAGFGRVVRWDIPLLDGYPFTFLSDKTRESGFEASLIGELIRHRPDVLVLHGYGRATNLVALAVAKMLGARVLMRGDTRGSAHRPRSAVRAAIKRTLFRLVDGCIAIGSDNRDYYRTLGVAERRISFSPMSVDNDAFALRARDRDIRADERRALGVGDATTLVLYAGKLTRQKRIGDLIEAFRRVRHDTDAVLVIAGSGPDESRLRELASGMRDRVRFLGFRNQTELPRVYAAADLFVLPSGDESWGLVVNEAMAAGLAVIVSDDIGAAPDLVDGKDTGIVYPCGDVDRLAEALERLLAAPAERERMGRNAAKLIERWSIDASAHGIADAVRAIARERRRA